MFPPTNTYPVVFPTPLKDRRPSTYHPPFSPRSGGLPAPYQILSNPVLSRMDLVFLTLFLSTVASRVMIGFVDSKFEPQILLLNAFKSTAKGLGLQTELNYTRVPRSSSTNKQLLKLLLFRLADKGCYACFVSGTRKLLEFLSVEGIHNSLTRKQKRLVQLLLFKVIVLTELYLLQTRLSLLKNMDRSSLYANQITPSFIGKWCVLVQVVERRNAKKKDNGPLYRNYMVTDSQGTKVPIVVFDRNVAHFANTLLPFKRYYISNAYVKETPQPYRVLEYPYTWTIYRKNLVEAYDDPIPPPLPCTFQFDKFSEFYRTADQEHSICIRAFIIQALPVQEGTTSATRDFVVINEEMIPILMRTWDDLLVDTDINIYARYKSPTLIIAYGLKVTTLNGLSLKTKTGAYILENPPLEEQPRLQEWYAAHTPEIMTLVQTRAYLDPNKLFHPPRPSEILPLDFALASIQNAKTVWTEGRLTYQPGQRKLWFEACEKCLTPLDVDIDWKIRCSVCQEFTRVCIRSEIPVTLKHGRTTIEAIIKSTEIDKLLPFTGIQLKLAAEKGEPLTKEIEEALKDKHVICFIKYYDHEVRGIMVRHYPIIKIYSEADIAEYDANHHASTETEATAANPTPLEHIGSSTFTPHVAVVEKEFFTPSTKAVLEEISTKQSIEQLQVQETSGTKRMLAFGETTSSTATDSASTEIQPCLPPDHATAQLPGHQDADPLQTTPSKKARAKPKQN